MPQFFVYLYGTSTPAPKNLWFRAPCSPDLQKDGATSATEREGARRKGPDAARVHSSGQRAALTPKPHGRTPAEAQDLQLWIIKPTDAYFQYSPCTEGRQVPWHCHRSTCNSLTLLRSATLFPHSLVLRERSWVLLSMGLPCCYLLFSWIAYWQVGTQPVLIFTRKPPDAVAHSTSR